MVSHNVVKNVFLPNGESCFEYLRQTRWKGTIRYPYCLSKDIWSDGTTPKGAGKYQCQDCKEYFNDLTGTIFDDRKFPLEEMFYILKEMEGKSTNQIAHELDRDYASVLDFVHTVHNKASRHAQKISLEGIVELDEAYIHAGAKGKKQTNARKREGCEPGDVALGIRINHQY
ncbi:MAG: IS1595 family transposase [Candidatus Thermoplasmatota archaeon]